MIKILDRNFVELAKEGSVGILVHPCNCFCSQTNDVSINMEIEFQTHFFKLESVDYFGLVDKLGRMESRINRDYKDPFYVTNVYTQYERDQPSRYGSYIDYDVFKVCMRKLNIEYPSAVFCIPIICNYKWPVEIKHIIDICTKELADANEIIICKS